MFFVKLKEYIIAKIGICSIDDIRMGNKIPHILSRYRKKSLDWDLVNIH